MGSVLTEKEMERMEMKAAILKKELNEVLDDVKYQGNCPFRRVVFLEKDRREGCAEFIEWIKEKYGKMMNNPRVTLRNLVGTLNKQTQALCGELDEAKAQVGMFEEDQQKKIEAKKKELNRMNALKSICFKGKAYFEFIYHAKPF